MLRLDDARPRQLRGCRSDHGRLVAVDVEHVDALLPENAAELEDGARTVLAVAAEDMHLYVVSPKLAREERVVEQDDDAKEPLITQRLRKREHALLDAPPDLSGGAERNTRGPRGSVANGRIGRAAGV